MYNAKIAEMFGEIASMLELEPGDRRFEVRAYRNAAMTLGTLQEDVSDILKKGGIDALMDLPGIGKGLAEKIKEYVETGRMKKYAEFKKKYPIDFANLTKIQGLGPKKAYKLYKELGIRNTDDLKKAIAAHKVAGIEGFGEKTETVMTSGLGMFESSKGRMLLGKALPEALRLKEQLLKSGLVETAEVAGSTRRMKETVGDLDILAISKKSARVMDFFTGLKEVESVIAKGPTKTTVRLKIGLNCDLRVLERKSFGAAMQYFTGNKDHNVELRKIAIKHGYKLNEYGLFDKKGRQVAGATEEEVYNKLGMDYMEPEMRENRGEIQLAMEHRLPKTVERKDIRGDLHAHTSYTDGADTIAEMAKAAKALGYEYLGMTDHSLHEYVTGGMDDKKFARYFDEIDQVNKKLDGITLLKSGEVDVLKDGSLDAGKKTLDRMDYVLAAIHTNLNMGVSEMTKRLVKAIESGYVDILAHPTERQINLRKPINLDLDVVFDAAKAHGVMVEIDSAPDRLDLNDENAIRAKKKGLRFSIDTDAHRTTHLDLMPYGIGVAKRAFLTKGDVINTLPLKKLLPIFK